jgi:hypothetical protein
MGVRKFVSAALADAKIHRSRCEFPTLGEPKCRKTARWRVVGYFNGRPQFRIRFCLQHLEQWVGRMKKAELPNEWKFEVQELA